MARKGEKGKKEDRGRMLVKGRGDEKGVIGWRGCESWIKGGLGRERNAGRQTDESILKGHGNEADFLGFLQKLGPHRFLTLP